MCVYPWFAHTCPRVVVFKVWKSCLNRWHRDPVEVVTALTPNDRFTNGLRLDKKKPVATTAAVTLHVCVDYKCVMNKTCVFLLSESCNNCKMIYLLLFIYYSVLLRGQKDILRKSSILRIETTMYMMPCFMSVYTCILYIHVCMCGWMQGWMHGCICVWMYENGMHVCTYVNIYMYVCMYVCMRVCMNEWMNEWMTDWLNEWRNEWMKVRMYTYMY